MDPFSVSGDAHALVGGAPQEVQPLGDVDAWFRKLCAAPSGVLYEDASLQVLHRWTDGAVGTALLHTPRAVTCTHRCRAACAARPCGSVDGHGGRRWA